MKESVRLFVIMLCALLTSCLSKEEILEAEVEILESDILLETIVIPKDFDYSTTKNISVQLMAPDYLNNASFSLMAYKAETDSLVFANASFAGKTYFETSYTVATYIDTILLNSNYMGMPTGVKIPILNGKAELDISKISREEEKSANRSSSQLKSTQENKYIYLGEYHFYNGLPKYLSSPDIIEQSLLEDINAALPEKSKVSVHNPDFIANQTTTRIELTKKADVWVTFVGESAEHMNSLGYYTYEAGHEPKSKNEIKEWFVVFPNASLAGSGGGLKPGDRVYLGQFEANTVIEWFLVYQGYVTVVAPTFTTYYSQAQFNLEPSASMKKHMVTLWDQEREICVMGFEETRRDNPVCDDDFNDVLYYTTTKPTDAVKTNKMAQLKTAQDSDNDGIENSQDAYPDDAEKAFNNYSPARNNYGTLAYEDLWPSTGDYDFNDLVVEYNYNLITNSNNKVAAMEARFKVKHIGGSLPSAFAFALPIAATQIESIENQKLNNGFISTNANGTESGIKEAVIFAFDNAREVKGQEIIIRVKFKTPINKAFLGPSPFNPFIVINEEREREIHLPDQPPTSKAEAYLGQNDDNSNASVGRYYRTKNNLPWALNFYSSFTAPSEKQSIDVEYDKFIPWAISSGQDHKEWYKRNKSDTD